jgi:competence transcription factor ComK
MIDYTGLNVKQFEILDDIMDNFDFDSVAQHMKDTNWMWADNTKSYKNYDDIKMYLRFKDIDTINKEIDNYNVKNNVEVCPMWAITGK